jgi:hypothetical protein
VIQAITLCHIDVTEINFLDTSYQLFPCPHKPDRSFSAQEVQLQALLHPPLILKLQQKYIPVSGHLLLEQLADNHLQGVHALVLDEKQLGKHDIFTLLIQHRMIHGSITSMDQAVLCSKASNHLSQQQLVNLLPAMGLKKNNHVLSEIISLLDLEKNAQLAIHEGITAVKSGRQLLRFSQDDQLILTRIIKNFRFGVSKQRNFLEAMEELIKREGKQAQYFLTLWEQEGKENQCNGPQQGNSLLEWLKRRCKPLSSKAEHDFAQFVQQLDLPENIALKHTPAFEDDQITLTIRYPSKNSFLQQWAIIRKDLSKTIE